MTEVPDMELRTALMVALKYISKNVSAGKSDVLIQTYVLY